MVALIKSYDVLVFDAVEGSVREEKWDGELDWLYEVMDCDIVDTIRVNSDNIFFVDDEGLLKSDQPGGFKVKYGNREVTFIGTGVLVGDKFGESMSIKLDVEKLDIHYFSYGRTEEEA
jgi:hypothetical protein